MITYFERLKATKQHLWFLAKQNYNYKETVLDNFFFDSFQTAFIIAPHMDDEILGSFQLIKILSLLGKEVKIIFCVSKNNGVETLNRMKESKKCFSSIEKYYLGLNDSKITEEFSIAKKKLLEILTPINSLYVYPEYVFANHTDHNAINRIMNEICLEQKQDNILKTELIIPIKRMRFLQIDNFEQKKQAIKVYKSQQNHIDYKRIINYLSTSGYTDVHKEHYSK